MELNKLLPTVQTIAKKAGDKIMQIYTQDFAVKYKNDSSPLTTADLAAHKIIVKELTRLTPNIPVLSEESADFKDRQTYKTLWVVDPLDGTKEFVNKNGEFTVNIALVQNGTPVLGVVYAPALGLMYLGAKGFGATKIKAGEQTQITAKVPQSSVLKVVASRSHIDEFLEEFLQNMGSSQTINTGSSLKFCLVAEGAAHIYPRFGQTTEWDSAAGDAIVRAAGGQVSQLNGEPLEYNKPDLLNPFFVAVAANAPEWQSKVPAELKTFRAF